MGTQAFLCKVAGVLVSRLNQDEGVGEEARSSKATGLTWLCHLLLCDFCQTSSSLLSKYDEEMWISGLEGYMWDSELGTVSRPQ